METLFEMKKRHLKERSNHVVEIVRRTRNISEAARILGCERKVIYRELEQAGVAPSDVKVKRPVWDLPTLAEGQTLDAWVNAAPPITAFAVVKDGKWYDRGDMGWWGCVSNEKDEHEWEREVAKLMSVYESDDWVTCVDCHI